MFLSSYEKMRERMLSEKTICSMAHLGARAFGSISGEVVQTTAFVLQNREPQAFKPVFFRLLGGGEEEKRLALKEGENRFDRSAQDEFKIIPGGPLTYWMKSWGYKLFQKCEVLKTRAVKGLDTNGAIDKFLRRWYEVSICENGPKKWFPLEKGGEFRKWYGNHEYVINYEDHGSALKANKANLRNQAKYFHEGLTWTVVTSSGFSVRYMPNGFLFDQGGSAIFSDDEDLFSWSVLAASLNSKMGRSIAIDLCPTLNFTTGDVNRFPILINETASKNAKLAVEIAKSDWDLFELSWDFKELMLVALRSETIAEAFDLWIKYTSKLTSQLKSMEEMNNSLYIDSYDLTDDLIPEVSLDQITLNVNPTFRYGVKASETESNIRFREDTMKELVSYSIGCMMGRYSLDEPGLIYAHSGNEGFDPNRYQTFKADDDGIIPLTDKEWFSDDAANRLEEFIATAWDAAHLEENLGFLADNLSPKKGESSRETLRRYLCDNFYKDHTQTYKKRPIYWLFTSGKQKAFQCLVYLHRYNEGTLARMRTQYVIPLTAKLAAHVN